MSFLLQLPRLIAFLGTILCFGRHTERCRFEWICVQACHYIGLISLPRWCQHVVIHWFHWISWRRHLHGVLANWKWCSICQRSGDKWWLRYDHRLRDHDHVWTSGCCYYAVQQRARSTGIRRRWGVVGVSMCYAAESELQLGWTKLGSHCWEVRFLFWGPSIPIRQANFFCSFNLGTTGFGSTQCLGALSSMDLGLGDNVWLLGDR